MGLKTIEKLAEIATREFGDDGEGCRGSPCARVGASLDGAEKRWGCWWLILSGLEMSTRDGGLRAAHDRDATVK